MTGGNRPLGRTLLRFLFLRSFCEKAGRLLQSQGRTLLSVFVVRRITDKFVHVT
nr:MAG TPA: hypothetical protein [Caudoviricetes sp.]